MPARVLLGQEGDIVVRLLGVPGSGGRLAALRCARVVVAKPFAEGGVGWVALRHPHL
jgi:hypothetical protein